jgi:DNA-binding CsgD family transcriptional regulator
MCAIMGKLTPREREAIILLMQGRRQREIAADMCITQRTVKAHIANARGKAGAKTTVELVALVAGEKE